MLATEKILELTKNNNGMINSDQITQAGISREYLRIFLKNDLLERVERGVYILPDCFEDEQSGISRNHYPGRPGNA